MKYIIDDFHDEQDTGLSKLQWLKIKEMNEHGMPAIGLVYSEPLNLFFFTTVLRDTLTPDRRTVMKLPGDAILSGDVIFNYAMEHLRGLGYEY